MPPKKASKDSTAKTSKPSKKPQSSDPFASDDEVEEAAARQIDDKEEDEPAAEKTIPKELLTRLLHEFFTKDATRISRDANAAVGKYVDVFVREAIARTAVEDLEKATPQLLLDL
ncbi:unnamed protein product [Clonostachys chloroleuca]|uniref:Centromere protein X n=1 Tax=Clonostachys chloroleuca TaxID=1926264 RepID=A0AA35MGZ3_9HYPO|nr:unnamed protein product [Clonostachys chloroleuca]